LNGTFVIDSKGKTILKDFDKKDFLTYQLNFSYDTDASAPIFQKYLDKVLPEIESQIIIGEFLAFIFIGNRSKTFKEEKALTLFGSGANGKSVFFEIVMALLGYENVSNYSLESLTNSSGYQRAGLRGKLLNYASEISPKLDPSLFKQLISGEPIECRLPYGNPFILRDYAKFIFNSNVLPKDVENTAAFFRRFLIVPFLQEIPPTEQDKNLHNKIIDNELSGVFNWVLSGLERLLKNQKFTESPLVEETVENFKIESDSVKLFLKENNYINSASIHIKIKDLYNQYRTFCLEDGYKPVNKSNFIKRLKNSGYLIQRINIGYVAYIQINIDNLNP